VDNYSDGFLWRRLCTYLARTRSVYKDRQLFYKQATTSLGAFDRCLFVISRASFRLFPTAARRLPLRIIPTETSPTVQSTLGPRWPSDVTAYAITTCHRRRPVNHCNLLNCTVFLHLSSTHWQLTACETNRREIDCMCVSTLASTTTFGSRRCRIPSVDETNAQHEADTLLSYFVLLKITSNVKWGNWVVVVQKHIPSPWQDRSKLKTRQSPVRGTTGVPAPELEHCCLYSSKSDHMWRS